MHRFYITPENWNPAALTLDAAESHHCLNVLRCQLGDKVAAFNGQGSEATATISGTDKKAVSLKTITSTKSPPLRAQITLGQAIPKGKNMELIVEKATELGAAAIIPLLSERTVVSLKPHEATKKQEKWQRTATEACKQSGQNWLPKVHLPQTAETFLASSPKADLLAIASLEGNARSIKETLAEITEHAGTAPQSALILIGPEGDFTPSEINKALSAGFRPLTLGPIVLRTETAAIYTLSVLAHELQGD